MKNVVLAFLAGVLITLVALGATFGFRYIGLKRNASDDRAIIQQLQTENQNITRQLNSAKGVVRGVADSINLVTKRIGEINNGLDEGGDLIDGSIAITEELFQFVEDIRKAIPEEFNNWNSN